TDGILITDANAVVREASHSARRLLGTAAEVAGRALADVWGDLRGAPEALAAAVRDGRTLEFLLERAEPPLFVATTLRPVFDVDGRATGAVLSLRDVTRETLEHKLQQDVLSLVSHKFRTPLTVLSLWIKLMKDGECGTPTAEQAEALAALHG